MQILTDSLSQPTTRAWLELQVSNAKDTQVPKSKSQPKIGKGPTLTDLVASNCRPPQMRLDSYALLFLCQKKLETMLGPLVLPRAEKVFFKKNKTRGAWVAQLVECWTLDFNSGHDLRVRGIESGIGFYTDSVAPGRDSLLLSLPLLSLRMHACTLSQNKFTKKKKTKPVCI